MAHLDADWLPAVEILNAGGASPVVLLCPHASNHIPAEYGSLGLPPAELRRHIAWDIGAAGLTRHLSQLLDAPAYLASYSRLLIDLNRPLDSTSSIVTRSEATEIPGNLALTSAERDRRIERIFEPFHGAIDAHLADRVAEKRPVAVVAIHSFTPTYHGVPRPWHVGVLFEKSVAMAESVMAALRAHPDLNVGANEPYTITRDGDYGLLVYGDDRGNPAIEFEIRQDLLIEPQDQAAWANRLADALAANINNRARTAASRVPW